MSSDVDEELFNTYYTYINITTRELNIRPKGDICATLFLGPLVRFVCGVQFMALRSCI